jgi:phosphoribosylaminoimidazolecarboxamide formyltransferase/IMP cyclohydrolase
MAYVLLSVYDKSGVVEFAEGLIKAGFQLLASGSTATLLREAKCAVREVSDYTKSPEMLNGRVKTLHPAIHGGILARKSEEDHQELLEMGWDYIDLVVVNLYPFTQTIAKPNVSLEEAIEQIDIGGVTLIRAAAKNYDRVTVVCEPADYMLILNELNQGKISLETRKKMAVKGFIKTNQYDAAISHYLDPALSESLTLYPLQSLRYGENPHQSAVLYSETKNAGPLGGKLLQGKELSYNNLLDLDAAFRAVCSFSKPTICIVKHLSPCGLASSDSLHHAFTQALECDPISAFGGIIASNKIIDQKTVEAFGSLFIECIAAPGFTFEAKDLLAKRSQCRLLEISDSDAAQYEWRSLHHGMLRQERDNGDPINQEWKVVTETQPTPSEWEDLKFAWLACQHVKSNAIVFAKEEAAVGIGGGQPNRIDCVKMAAVRAGEKSKGAVMASDAFFPFSDTVEEAVKYGITAIIQPGGSKRDAEVILAANVAKIAMIFTGVRHFRH